MGRGCFVSAAEWPIRKDAKLRLLSQEIDDAVVQAHHLQIQRDAFLRLAADRFDAFHRRRDRAAGE